jgi:uncharacterized protein
MTRAVSDPQTLASERPHTSKLRVWIDIDNPAQVQYLLRIKSALTKLDADVLLTARAMGMTADLIEGNGATATIVGGELGRSKMRKGAGTLRRAIGLSAVVRSWGRPAIAIATSRAAALASLWMGISHFVLLDYEFVDLNIYRRTRCWILHPEVIQDDFFVARGFRRSKVIAFRGLKEDITFSATDPGLLSREIDHGPYINVLVRPPSEKSHYHVSGSSDVTRDVLASLSKRSDVRVTLSPRHPSQRKYLESHTWLVDPVFVDRATPFLELLSGADAVVSAGGTMLREAAYMGIPAFSTFQGSSGAVDRHLALEGRLAFIQSAADFDEAMRARPLRRPPLRPSPDLMDELIKAILMATPATTGLSTLRRSSLKQPR